MQNGLTYRHILGVKVISSRLSEVINLIEDKIKEKSNTKPFFVVTVNLEFLMIANQDVQFNQILNKADLVVPDGGGLGLISSCVEEIIPGREVVKQLLKNDYRVFFLGSGEGIAQEMARKFGGQGEMGHKNIKLEWDNEQINETLIKTINRFEPDLLLVAYGAPWQEKWIWKNKDKLKAKVVMGVGGTFDYLVGKSTQPPAVVSKMGLEWLWRLVHEPYRWERQLKQLTFWLKVKLGLIL